MHLEKLINMVEEFCEKSLWEIYKVSIFFFILYLYYVIEVCLCKIRLENILNHRRLKNKLIIYHNFETFVFRFKIFK